ncbi:MAG: hypothetical protein HQK51_07875 [Oligoflexia bacterium]|nr:hypothetical protein [Oligoflexia bacterium]
MNRSIGIGKLFRIVILLGFLFSSSFFISAYSSEVTLVRPKAKAQEKVEDKIEDKIEDKAEEPIQVKEEVATEKPVPVISVEPVLKESEVDKIKTAMASFGTSLGEEQLESFKERVALPISRMSIPKTTTQKDFINNNFSEQEKALIKQFFKISNSKGKATGVTLTDENLEAICSSVLASDKVVEALQAAIKEAVKEVVGVVPVKQKIEVPKEVQKKEEEDNKKPFTEGGVSKTLFFDREYVQLMEELFPESAGLSERNNRMRWKDMIVGDGGFITFIEPYYQKDDGMSERIKPQFSAKSDLNSVARYLGFPAAEKPAKDDLGKESFFMFKKGLMIIKNDHDKLSLTDHQGKSTVNKITCRVATIKELKEIKAKRAKEAAEAAEAAKEDKKALSLLNEDKAKSVQIQKDKEKKPEEAATSAAIITKTAPIIGALETQRAFVKLLTIKGMTVDMAQIKQLSHSNQFEIFKMMLDQGYSPIDIGAIAKLSTDIHKDAIKVITDAKYEVQYDQIRALTIPQQVNMLQMMIKEGYKQQGQDKKILNITGLASLDATGKIGDLYQSVIEAITKAGKTVPYEQIKSFSNKNQLAMLKMMLDQGYSPVDIGAIAKLSTDIHKDAMKVITDAKYDVQYDQIRALTTPQQVNMLQMMINAGYKQQGQDKNILDITGLETLRSDVHKDAMKILTDANYEINYDQIALLKNQNQVAILKSFIENNYNNGEKMKLNLKFISENNLSTDVHKAAIAAYLPTYKQNYPDIIYHFKNMNQVRILEILIKNNYAHSNEAAKNVLTWIAALPEATTSQVDAIREMSASGKSLPSTEAISLF